MLTSCCFPGNVRELENCVRRTATLAAGNTIVAGDFACQHDECLSAVLWKGPARPPAIGYVPLPIGRARGGQLGGASTPETPASADAHDWSTGTSAPSIPPPSSNSGSPTAVTQLGKTERERLIEAMESAGWVQAKAARLLGISPRQIGYALRKFDIPIKRF